MSFEQVRVYANCDMALVAWEMDAAIPGCRGFALERDVEGAGDASKGFVNTYVGFAGGAHMTGDAEPSTKWPIQRFTWNDLAPSSGQKVRYRVIPMMGTAANLTQADAAQWSGWSDWATVGTGQTRGFSAYFNRGIVGAQFLAAQAKTSAAFTAMLKTDINQPGSKNRDFLAGALLPALKGLLSSAKADGATIYAALYELNDPDVIACLTALGPECNLLLGNGAFKPASGSKPAEPDENAAVRAQLKKDSKVNVFDRIVTGSHFAHNKFIVFCDRTGKPAKLWTGSTNCTVNGLCTQVNNGLLIEDATLAAAYKQRWDELKAAGNEYPASLMVSGSTPATATVGAAPVTAWNVPCLKFVDMACAKKYIQAATQGVLFLFFNPGTGGGDRAESLLQDIQDVATKGLYLHGVINQAQVPDSPHPDQSDATVQFTDGGKLTEPVSTIAITPKELTDSTKSWFKETFQYGMVMIHSKVVLIDPFGDHPVLMTGSHNMGPKASQENDDNMVIVEHAPGLAAEYAVNILGVYGHYKWL